MNERLPIHTKYGTFFVERNFSNEVGESGVYLFNEKNELVYSFPNVHWWDIDGILRALREKIGE